MFLCFVRRWVIAIYVIERLLFVPDLYGSLSSSRSGWCQTGWVRYCGPSPKHHFMCSQLPVQFKLYCSAGYAESPNDRHPRRLRMRIWLERFFYHQIIWPILFFVLNSHHPTSAGPCLLHKPPDPSPGVLLYPQGTSHAALLCRRFHGTGRVQRPPRRPQAART